MKKNTEQKQARIALSKIKENLPSAITVALISFPLSIALAVASGGTPLQGILTGFWATLFASIFISSNYNIIGVAGALSPLLLAAVTNELFISSQIPGPYYLSIIALFSGVIIFLIYIARLDKYLKYISKSVMTGFATGVALLIFISQLFDGFGLNSVKKSAEFLENVSLFAHHISDIHTPSFIVFIISFIVLLIWKRKIKSLPGIIPVSIAGILLGATTFFSNLNIVTIGQKFPSINVKLFEFAQVGYIKDIFHSASLLEMTLKASFVVAMISVLETLITAKLGDVMTKTETNPKRELFGLSLSNILSGIVGGLPSTGVFIRTGANIKAGATHRTSGILTALFTGIIGFILIKYFRYLPMPVLAGVLCVTAVGLIEVKELVHFYKREKSSFIISLLVILVTVIFDAGAGVVCGVLAGLFILIRSITPGHCSVSYNSDKEHLDSYSKNFSPTQFPNKVTSAVYSFSGFVSYLDVYHSIEHLRQLMTLPNLTKVILRMRDVHYMDLESIEALANEIEEFRKNNKRIVFSSVSKELQDQLIHNTYFKNLTQEKHFFEKTSHALS